MSVDPGRGAPGAARHGVCASSADSRVSAGTAAKLEQVSAQLRNASENLGGGGDAVRGQGRTRHPRRCWTDASPTGRSSTSSRTGPPPRCSSTTWSRTRPSTATPSAPMRCGTSATRSTSRAATPPRGIYLRELLTQDSRPLQGGAGPLPRGELQAQRLGRPRALPGPGPRPRRTAPSRGAVRLRQVARPARATCRRPSGASAPRRRWSPAHRRGRPLPPPQPLPPGEPPGSGRRLERGAGALPPGHRHPAQGRPRAAHRGAGAPRHRPAATSRPASSPRPSRSTRPSTRTRPISPRRSTRWPGPRCAPRTGWEPATPPTSCSWSRPTRR